MRNADVWIAAAVGAGLILWFTREPQQPGGDLVSNALLPRGIRNNNPFNIKITNISWNGKRPRDQNTDGTFEQFVDAYHGLRAGARDLWTKYNSGLDNVRAIISKFAPPNENDTESYIRSVSRYVGVSDTGWLSVHNFPALMRAIIAHENGAAYRDYYPDSLIYQAIKSATGMDITPPSVMGVG